MKKSIKSKKFLTHKRINLTYQILKIIALMGMVTTFAIVPGLTMLIVPFLKEQKNKNKDQIAHDRIFQTIWRLKQRGLIKKDSKGRLSLTPKGQKQLFRYQLKELSLERSRQWDGKWRIIAFDVWEKRRFCRDLLRNTLKRVGFVKLQRSLWVYPYECEELIALLRTDLRLSRALQYIIAEQIDQDSRLRKYFKLPSKKV